MVETIFISKNQRKLMSYIVESPYLKMWIEEGILYSVFTDKLDINIEIARDCVNERILFSKWKSYPCLIDMQGVRSVTKDAREYLATEGESYITAGALIVGSVLTRMIGNMFISINKPKVPVRLFTNKEEAKLWLKNYID